MSTPRHVCYKSVVVLLVVMFLLQYLYFYPLKTAVPKINSPVDSLFYIGPGPGLGATVDSVDGVDNESSLVGFKSPQYISEDVVESSAPDVILQDDSCLSKRKLGNYFHTLLDTTIAIYNILRRYF